uniref:O-GlcNAc transferase C-terminal domain-containing protein n=1 Tax=Palpitomonas bilix TaxID=652834 RepID=A0A7S3FYL3_9EUKA
MTAMEVASEANALSLALAVDLNGFVAHSMPDLFLLRPAPVVVADQGFPSTHGGIADYFHGHKVGSPPEYASFYSEKLVLLPHFANPLNNHWRLFGDMRRRRGTQEYRNEMKQKRGSIFGRVINSADSDVYCRSHPFAYEEENESNEEFLPSSSRTYLHRTQEDRCRIVYAVFHNPYKVDNLTVGMWSDILQHDRRSSLWLLKWTDSEKASVRALSKSGASTSQLLITPHLARASHLEDKAVADMFLDSHAYNAHGTCSEALWSEIPVVTLPGLLYSQRVCAMLITSYLDGIVEEEGKQKHTCSEAGLVARSAFDYRYLAKSPYFDQDRLLHIRYCLRRYAASSPIFDIRLFSCHFFRAFRLEVEVATIGESRMESGEADTNAKRERCERKRLGHTLSPIRNCLYHVVVVPC